jgi:AcrR family transcriptional regulator
MSATAPEPGDLPGASPADGRREQLLEAALTVIAERGFPETRIADVAASAGTSPALVIYYFKTRDQLLTEAIRLSEDRWYAEGTARIANIPTAAGRLEELVAMTCVPPGGRGRPDLVADLARSVGAVGAASRGCGGPPRVRRALAPDDLRPRARRSTRRRVRRDQRR